MKTYQYLDSQGNMIGPVSLEMLRQIKGEGKISGNTQVLDEELKRFTTLDQALAATGGIVFPTPPAAAPPPPPPPSAKKYYYADLSNTPVGPFTIDELQQQFVSGKIRSETQVIEDGGTVWQLYSKIMMQRLSDSSGGVSVPPPPPSSNSNEVSMGTAILWFLICCPVGFMQWGQSAKGWVWLLIAIFTSGIGGLVALVDYWMCFSAQQKRKLGEWEFFPRK
jgi:hypothetical protein